MRHLVLFLLLGCVSGAAAFAQDEKPAHELVGKFAPLLTRATSDGWINSPPLTWGALNGKVVLLEIWNVGSWNSIRAMPWMRDLYRRLQPKGFEIVAVHNPEFPHEKDRTALRRKIEEFKITFPIMLDENGAYVQALGGAPTRPTFLLIDKRGKVHSVFEGESQLGDAVALSIESDLAVLMNQVN